MSQLPLRAPITTSWPRHSRNSTHGSGPEGQRSESVPSASLLASGDQWHLTTAHGRIDIIAPPARLGSFDEMRERAHLVPLGDLSVPIASREDLLTLKRAAGRPQDLADVRLLESLDDGSK